MFPLGGPLRTATRSGPGHRVPGELVGRCGDGYASGVAVIRPDPLHWVLYAFGAGLPRRNREWVLHDVTARTWFLRQVLRAVVQVAPIAVLLWVLLDPVLGFDTAISLTAVAMGVVIGLFYGTAFAWGSTEHRAVKAGYPEGTVERVRGQRRRREASERAAHRG
jgi:hypothetical protein